MDLIENGSEDGSDFDVPYGSGDPTWGHPTVLAVTSILLAFLVLMGASILRGTAYTSTFIAGGVRSIGDNNQSWIIAGAFVSVGFAFVPLVIARIGLHRLVPSDGAWTAHLLRVGFLLSALAVALRLVLALETLHDATINGLTLQL